MPVHNFRRIQGKLVYFVIDSRHLSQNLLGDPASRTVAVYLPADYETSGVDYPLFVQLAAFTGSGLKELSWKPFVENVPQRLDRLIEEKRMGPVIAAFPDCFTSVGGNQYVNSSALGFWEDFLLEEMLPELEKRFRVRKAAASRAVFGFSSGGYGAMIQALRHGSQWGAAACHSADMGFDISMRGEFPAALTMLSRFDHSVERFLEHFWRAPKVQGPELHLLMLLALAASYDPDPEAAWGIRLPVDLHTCRLDPERWQRWLEHDPAEMVGRPACQTSLGLLRNLYIDCGSQDQYHLQYGNRLLHERLTKLGIAHLYEEFDDNHSGVDYRLDRSLPCLFQALNPETAD